MNREEILKELHEVELDLKAFSDARNAIHFRIHEMEGSPRQEAFEKWAMTQIILNSFVLAIVRCEGLVEDLRKALNELEVPQNVVQLTCVKGDQDGPGGE